MQYVVFGVTSDNCENVFIRVDAADAEQAEALARRNRVLPMFTHTQEVHELLETMNPTAAGTGGRHAVRYARAGLARAEDGEIYREIVARPAPAKALWSAARDGLARDEERSGAVVAAGPVLRARGARRLLRMGVITARAIGLTCLVAGSSLVVLHARMPRLSMQMRSVLDLTAIGILAAPGLGYLILSQFMVRQRWAVVVCFGLAAAQAAALCGLDALLLIQRWRHLSAILTVWTLIAALAVLMGYLGAWIVRSGRR